MKTEPAIVTATVTGVVAAIIALLTAFGINVEDSQKVAILGVVAVLAPIVSGIITRQNVFAPATVTKLAGTDAGQVPPTV